MTLYQMNMKVEPVLEVTFLLNMPDLLDKVKHNIPIFLVTRGRPISKKETFQSIVNEQFTRVYYI
jgi:hypothetical protein